MTFQSSYSQVEQLVVGTEDPRQQLLYLVPSKAPTKRIHDGQSDNENYSAREPLQTKVVNDKTICKWRVNQDQTNNSLIFIGYLQEGQLGVVFEDFSWYPLYLVSTQVSTTTFT